MLLTGLNSLHLFEEIVDYNNVHKQSNEKRGQQDTSDDNILSLLFSSTIIEPDILHYIAQDCVQRKRIMNLDVSV